MAIQGTGKPPVIRPGAAAGGGANAAAPQATPTDAVVRLGMFRPGLDAQGALGKLLSFLVLQGFAKPPDAKAGGQPLDDAAKLAEMIKQLQANEGLPQTGKLDDKTMKALEKMAKSGGDNVERQAANPEKQSATRMAASFRENTLAAWIKNKSAEIQKPPQNPTSNQPGNPSNAQQPATSAKVNDPYQMQQDAFARLAKQENEQRAAQTDGRMSSQPGDGKPPPAATSQARPGQGQGQDGQGQQAMQQGAKGTGEQTEKVGGRSSDEEGLERGDADQLTAFEDGRGNQATGDEDEEDERRGAALVDDGSGTDEGAYEVPSIREQLRDALGKLAREDDSESMRTTTYRAEFLLYKPGVYQSRTMAPQLLNLKVVRATAYDAVWSEVVEQVNARLRVFEPDEEPLDASDIQTALQLARVR